ncbi:MAG: aminomethyl-transferring glycine dehydrogenase subunit GcvPA [Blastocatellia bacterium]|nr:aminomethyl-transferring glycine dehydrogenase subunit GcvPA [Blastocatellia bacterium]
MRYIPSSAEERSEMLASMGKSDIMELFESIPERLRLSRPLNLPAPKSEFDLAAYFRDLADRNRTSGDVFLGAGVYDHFAPVVIDHMALRSEWYTAYTPYQPELSQGTLQAIFEFQTMVCQLTGLEVANASLYDGSTAVAEAVLMALRVNKGRHRVVMAASVHPHYRAVVNTYLRNSDVEIVEVGFDSTGRIDLEAAALDGNTAAIVVQSPNFFGVIENLDGICTAARDAGALSVVGVAEAMSLGVLKAPGDSGADIVCGEAQSFGVPMSFGGPFVGFFATREKFVRQLPGRLVGRALDSHGQLGFVLTLSTREQHIRREKATSNICTNQGLFMLMATIYLSTMGRKGLREVAEQNIRKAHEAAARIASLPGYTVKFSGPTFNEFVVSTPRPARQLRDELAAGGIVAGVPLDRYYAGMDNDLLIAVTETASIESIDRLVSALAEFGGAN